jgi:hypothetical protein
MSFLLTHDKDCINLATLHEIHIVLLMVATKFSRVPQTIGLDWSERKHFACSSGDTRKDKSLGDDVLYVYLSGLFYFVFGHEADVEWDSMFSKREVKK